MNKESKISKIGMIISAVGILAIIAVAMINYFSIDNFIKPIYASLNYYFRDPENAHLTIEDKVSNIKISVEDLVNEVFLKDKYIYMNTHVDLLLGDRLFTDADQNVGLLDNGYLSFINEKEDNTDDKLNYMMDLQEKIEKSNPDTEMLYIQAPFKLSKFDRQLPEYITENTNEMMDKLLSGLNGKIDYLDLRQVMYDQNVSHYDFFFKTDHHWTAEAGFWANNEISKLLESNYGFTINNDYLNIDNYETIVYENVFLGSEGKRIGEGLVEKDDMSIILPKFDTDFLVNILQYNEQRYGSFEDCFIDYDNISIDDKYTMYLGGGYHVSIKNNNSVNNKKILLVRDSYANVVSPYLASNCEQIDILYLNNEFIEKSVEEYVQEIDPDLVMFLYTHEPLIGYDKLLP